MLSTTSVASTLCAPHLACGGVVPAAPGVPRPTALHRRLVNSRARGGCVAASALKTPECSSLTRRSPAEVHQSGACKAVPSLVRHRSKPSSLHATAKTGKAEISLQSQAAALSSSDDDVVALPSARTTRLNTLVELRNLYRNCLRAHLLLQEPSPVYTPLPEVSSSSSSAVDGEEERDPEEEERRIAAAVELVADMQLTSERLKASLRALPVGFGIVLSPSPKPKGSSKSQQRDAAGSAGGSSAPGGAAGAAGGAAERAGDVEQLVVGKARDYALQLRDRAASELLLLPFPTEAAAQAAVDARNSRYLPSSRLLGGPPPLEEGQLVASPIERLGKAEKVAEKFVEQRIKPALKRAQQGDLVEVVAEGGQYLRGLWDRLNGGGATDPSLSALLELPRPTSTRKEIDAAISELALELGSVEKRLQDASKERESKLRKAGGQGRVRLASTLKLLDAEVLALSRQLAVQQLQLELEFVFRSLEEEALEVVRDSLDTRTLGKDSSTEELALLAAEFSLLEEQLQLLQGALEAATLSLAADELLDKLAEEIPDMRARVGVSDQVVYGGSGWSITKVQLALKEAREALAEAVSFLMRGIKLLGSDLSNSGRLFAKAALGGTLRPREVTALRRTATDLLAFIPFTIILIIPLSPLGHVLVFGFIQRYFPSLFPSQFSTRRQEIMTRYEELAEQLQAAQQQAEQEEEEAELARAAAAVARLTAPLVANTSAANGALAAVAKGPTGGSEADNPVGEAAKKVKLLEQKMEAVMEDVTAGDDEAPPSGRGGSDNKQTLPSS